MSFILTGGEQSEAPMQKALLTVGTHRMGMHLIHFLKRYFCIIFSDIYLGLKGFLSIHLKAIKMDEELFSHSFDD